MKTCVTCHKEKDESGFNRRASSKDGLQPRCRDCGRLWYQQNKAKHKANVKKSRAARLRKRRQWLWDYYLQHPCVTCGESDPIVLEFNHLDPEAKTECVAVLMASGVSMKQVEEEIQKCEVLCANCHKRATADQMGWYAEQRECSQAGKAADF